MKLQISFTVVYEMLFKLNKLYHKDREKFKKNVILFEASVLESIGLNKIELSGISFKEYPRRDCVVLASTIMEFTSELPYGLRKVAGIFTREFASCEDDGDDEEKE